MNRVRPLISPAKVIKFCLSLLSTHLQTLYTDLDPVKDFKVDAQSRKHYQTINHRKLGQKGGGNGEQGSLFKKTSSSLNLHYLFPLLSMLAINAHSAYLLCKTNFTLYDRLFPRACWPQGDVIANVGFVLAAAVFLALLLQEPFSSSKSKLMMMSLLIVVDQKGTGEEVEEGVRMFQDGKEMSPEEALLITRFRRRISSAMPALMATFYLEFGLFCLVNFFVNLTAVPIYTSFSEMLALLFTLLIIAYLPFSNFFLIYYFSLCIKYLLIKQGRRMRRAETLLQRSMITTKNSFTSSSSSSSSSSSVSTSLAQVSLLYGSFARLCAETAGQNRFWSLLLTLYYLSYIIEIVHFSYVFLFVPNTIGPLYYVLLLGAVQFLAILVYVTTICSRLTRAGDRLHRRLQQVLFEECCQPADDRHLKRWRETRLLLPAALRLNQMAAATSDTAHGQMPGGHLSAGHRAAD